MPMLSSNAPGSLQLDMADSLHCTKVCRGEGAIRQVLLYGDTHSEVRIRALLREMVQCPHCHQTTELQARTVLHQILYQVTGLLW